jgi:hypothetical protein
MRGGEVTGGGFTTIATTEPFVLSSNAQGNPPFRYSWVGPWSLEFRDRDE